MDDDSVAEWLVDTTFGFIMFIVLGAIFFG